MGRMRPRCAYLCESCLVHIFHCRCWLEEFTSASWLHRPICHPCCQPPSQACSSLQNLLPLSPEMCSPWPDWQPFSVDSHLTSHLSHTHLPSILDPGVFWDPHFLWPLTLCTFSFPTASPKLDPRLQQLQLPRLSAACKVHLWASLPLSTAPCPPLHSPVGPCWVLQTLLLPLAGPLVSCVRCSPIIATVAEPSPSFGSLLRRRVCDLAPDEVENNLDTGCPSQKIWPRTTWKAEEKNISRQKSKVNAKMW